MFSFFTRLRFFLNVASEIKVGPSVSPAVISSVSFPPAEIQRKRGRERGRARERGGKRSGCLKVCGRHVMCCALVWLIYALELGFKSHQFDLCTRRSAFLAKPTNSGDVTARQKDTKVQKGCGGWGTQSVNKSDLNPSVRTRVLLTSRALILFPVLCYWTYRQVCSDTKLLATWTRIGARLRPGSRSCTSAGTRRRSWRPSSAQWWTPARRPDSRPLCLWGWGNCRTPSSGSQIPVATQDK